MTSENTIIDLFMHRIHQLEEHKNRQIDENRKISARVDELSSLLHSRLDKNEINISKFAIDLSNFWERLDDIDFRLEDNLKSIYMRINDLEKIYASSQTPDHKKPHKCPVCSGGGTEKHPLNGLLQCACHACEGKGIVWG